VLGGWQAIESVITAFLDDGALQRFLETKGWKAGVDGSITVLTLGAGGAVDPTNLKTRSSDSRSIRRGLNAKVTFEGSNFTKLDKT